MSQEEKPSSSAYKHSQKSVQRPDVGVEAQFPNKKAPKTYRYDSSLAPELCWDENAERPFAEWLLHLIVQAAEKGAASRHFSRYPKWGPLRFRERKISDYFAFGCPRRPAFDCGADTSLALASPLAPQ